MLLETTSRSRASSSVRNSRVETGSFAAFKWRKKSMSMAALARPLELVDEMLSDRRPFALDDAEHDRVAIAAIGRYLVIAQDRVLLRAQPQDRLAGRVIEPVRAELHRDAFELFERVREEQQLALGVEGAALHALRVPRVADLESPIRAIDVKVARASDDLSGRA